MKVIRHFCDICNQEVEPMPGNICDIAWRELRILEYSEIVKKGFDMCPKCRREYDQVLVEATTQWLASYDLIESCGVAVPPLNIPGTQISRQTLGHKLY